MVRYMTQNFQYAFSFIIVFFRMFGQITPTNFNKTILKFIYFSIFVTSYFVVKQTCYYIYFGNFTFHTSLSFKYEILQPRQKKRKIQLDSFVFNLNN